MKIKLLYIILLAAQWAIAQEPAELPEPTTATADTTAQKTKSDFAIIPSVGYVLQQNSFAEANVIIGSTFSEYLLVGHKGIRVGMESNLQNGPEQIIAPKIGFEAANLIAVMRLSAIDYIQGSKSELRLLPEIGFTVIGLIDVTWGYGFRLTDTNIGGISGHRLGVAINFSRKLLKEL